MTSEQHHQIPFALQAKKAISFPVLWHVLHYKREQALPIDQHHRAMRGGKQATRRKFYQEMNRDLNTDRLDGSQSKSLGNGEN
jgi:hypothetical protein